MALECVKSVKKYSKNAEIIIVDNGSTVRYAWEKECDTYIRFNENKGISRGWNDGIKVARGKYITIIGDDTIVAEGWLESMLEGFKNPDCGMCNPHVEHLPDGVGLVESYKWPSGACFMVNRNTIDKVGYFDEDLYFPAQFEDTDYWWRMYKVGLKIYVNYAVTVQHREAATDGAPDISPFYKDNYDRFIKKHGIDPVPIFYGNERMP